MLLGFTLPLRDLFAELDQQTWERRTVAFFPDLSPYTYFPGETDTVNIGWLDRSEPFPTGETSGQFQDKLGRLISEPVMQTRGFHRCPFCRGGDRPRGSAEIRVKGWRKNYAAPVLIHHYVVAHGYKPPEEFIEAVLAWT